MKTNSKLTQLASCTTVVLCALPCEAMPLIRALNAQHCVSELGFKLYTKSNAAIVVTGVGRNAMSAAVVWAKTQLSNAIAWLNVGVAGHKDAELGALKVAVSVREAVTDKVFYPHVLFKSLSSEKLIFSELLTVDKASKDYSDKYMVDMEASAFIETTRRFAASEAVQVLKVISDNEQNDYSNINAAYVEKLLESQCEKIIRFIEEMNRSIKPICENAKVKSQLDELESRMRFSVSQRLQLEKRLAVINHVENLKLGQYTQAKSLLDALEQYIQSTPPVLRDS